jgi:formylglycine-generating enzyme
MGDGDAARRGGRGVSALGADTMVRLDGGAFLMGSEDPERVPGDAEDPVREVVVAPFAIDRCAVSNRRFAEFVAATGHATDAERFGWSFVFAGLLPDDFPPTRALAAAPWWRQVHGADWRHPEGPHSGVDDRLDHPVVHVSHCDALAFCAWARLRLPTEAEWELAARGGLEQARYPWGDELTPGGEHRCNIWQGEFPLRDTAEDGYSGTAPVDVFAPNGFGLHNMAGNVWEWCAEPFRAPSAAPGAMVIRGGSYLCHASYCNRYRVSARTGTTPDSSTGHTGFRGARDV